MLFCYLFYTLVSSETIAILLAKEIGIPPKNAVLPEVICGIVEKYHNPSKTVLFIMYNDCTIRYSGDFFA